MKKIILLAILLCWFSYTRALQIPETENYILTEDPQQVLNTDGINDPIRDGAYKIVDTNANNGGWSGDELIGILGPGNQISNHSTAENATLGIVKNVLNYVLSFLALVALIYLIFNGYLILTAAGDETQYKKGIKSLQYAVMAIAGIGASRLLVSLILRLLNLIISP